MGDVFKKLKDIDSPHPKQGEELTERAGFVHCMICVANHKKSKDIVPESKLFEYLTYVRNILHDNRLDPYSEGGIKYFLLNIRSRLDPSDNEPRTIFDLLRKYIGVTYLLMFSEFKEVNKPKELPFEITYEKSFMDRFFQLTDMGEPFDKSIEKIVLKEAFDAQVEDLEKRYAMHMAAKILPENMFTLFS